MLGRIEIAWERSGKIARLSIAIPHNHSAFVHLPTNKPQKVKETSPNPARAPGVRELRAEANEAVYAVGSGRYTFEFEL